MPKIAGRIIDRHTGEALEARVQALSVEGRFLHPKNAILKVGPGIPFFYSSGEFVLDPPCGFNQILVERGTEYKPARLRVEVPKRGTAAVDILLERSSDLSERGWYPGNTHIHYDQHEKRPEERLRRDSRIEDLRVTAISILKRWDRPYAVNKFSPGVLTDFCSAHHHVECGEESRHNDRQDSLDEGYGHIMLLRIKEIVDPVSRGYLVDDLDPDYPPLCYACDDAHRQGGIVIWCHNGRGMEAPVAAALGKLDAFNLFDRNTQWFRQIEANAEDTEARLEADRNFHATIFTACHNIFLTQMNTTVGTALRATQQIGSHLAGIMEESVLSHKEVADAIAKHDSQAARAAMERLVLQSTGHIQRVLHPDNSASFRPAP